MDTKFKKLIEKALELIEPISPIEIQKNIEDYFIIDVREPDEVSVSGKVKGVLNIPKGVIETAMKLGKEVKADQPIVVYCESGNRAALAGKCLMDAGYTNIYNLGGFNDWVKAGGQIEFAA
ncbi:rhodanese-like domain-containing protein [Gammaproteobacteria bacterium]|nr:rhodanese-like domain-containing protein [Gammaproteobacteria bacterium]